MECEFALPVYRAWKALMVVGINKGKQKYKRKYKGMRLASGRK
jgi:hypothetical protein